MKAFQFLFSRETCRCDWAAKNIWPDFFFLRIVSKILPYKSCFNGDFDINLESSHGLNKGEMCSAVRCLNIINKNPEKDVIKMTCECHEGLTCRPKNLNARQTLDITCSSSWRFIMSPPNFVLKLPSRRSEKVQSLFETWVL